MPGAGSAPKNGGDGSRLVRQLCCGGNPFGARLAFQTVPHEQALLFATLLSY